MARFEKTDSFPLTYIVSINIIPEKRNKGLGKNLLRNLIKKVWIELNDCSKLIALVKKNNESSKRLFLSCGFKLMRVNNNSQTYELNR